VSAKIFFTDSSLFLPLDNVRRALFFIHNGRDTVTPATRRPHNHAALKCKPLKKKRKAGRIFFNR
jgi:hypothetical protein